MSQRRLPIFAALVTFLLALTLGAPAATAGTYLLTAHDKLPADLEAAVLAAGGSLVRLQEEIGVAQAASDDPGFAARMAAHPGIKGVAPDARVRWVPTPGEAVAGRVTLPADRLRRPEPGTSPRSAAAVPAFDPGSAFFYPCQWNLAQIDAPGAWAQGALGSPRLKVAVLDTGVDYNHVELTGRIDLAQSRSFLTPGTSACGAADEESVYDNDFHGTFVSSLITGNAVGIASVAPHTKVVMVKVLDCDGSGTYGEVLAGLYYAGGLPDVDVISISLGWYLPRAGNEAVIEAFDRAVALATLRGKLVVVAAGNRSVAIDPESPNVFIPAQSLGAIAIDATNILEQLATYSDFGSAVWMAAPGGDFPEVAPPLPGCALPAVPGGQPMITAACALAFCGSDNGYLESDGTSFAAPMVAAVAELMDASRGGTLGPLSLAAFLASTASPIGSRESFGHGLLDAAAAVAAVKR